MSAQTGLLFVFDKSGSMTWAVDGNDHCPVGHRRIDLAKREMTNAIAGLPDDLPLGLIVFPHVNPCAPGFLLPIVANNKGKILRLIHKLDARWTPNEPVYCGAQPGGTPLGEAIRLAGQVVRQTGKTRVVVLTDGCETCGGNPLVEVAMLRNHGVALDLHIIGFSVDHLARFQLIQLAAVTGGHYHDCRDHRQLQAAVGSATRLLPPAAGFHQAF